MKRIVLALALFAGCAGPRSTPADSDVSGPFVSVHEVDVGILMRGLGTKAYDDEQRAFFKKALSQVVNSIWDEPIVFPDPAVGAPPPPEFWFDSDREKERREKLEKALATSLSAAYQGQSVELTLDKNSAGCVPKLKDCTDERTCPWDSFRAYEIKLGGAALTCKKAVDLYNAWRADGTHNGPLIQANSQLVTLPLYALHSHKFTPSP